MKAGPKAAADKSRLPFRPRGKTEAERFEAFAKKFLKVPKGTGVKGPLTLRDWQRDIAADILDSGARTVGLMLPRGQGKTTLLAAIGLYVLYTGGEAAHVVIFAVDERQAGLAFGAARRMVELNDDLGARVQIYKDRLYLPGTDSSMQVMPASAAAAEGLDYVLAIVDEAGVVSRDLYEVVQLAQGKREKSVLVAIGTPGPNLEDQVLLSLRDYAHDHPEDTSQRWREFSAAGFEDHPPDCEHCWELANPALDDFLHRDAIKALLPPKTREATFRRARLCQLATDTEGGFLPPGVWAGLDTGEKIPKRSKVVIALDGSFSDDSTALVLATVSPEPHFDVLRVWQKPQGEDGWRVPVLEVEDTIRQACRDFDVTEIVADPFRFARTLQVLESEKLPIVEFPWSPSRVTAATGDFYSACIAGKVSHSGAHVLAAHIGAAVLREDARGVRIDKRSRSRSARKIDCAAAALMAHSRAVWRARRPSRRVKGFK